MKKTVSVAEAKRDLTSLIRHSESENEQIVITRRGKPVSVLLGFKEYEKLHKLSAYAGMLRLSKELSRTGVSASELFDQSRQELEKRS